MFIALLAVDRTIGLFHFGFIYTDLDQTLMWNGAIDYSRGIFHEPFFYGQSYNYMLEGFLAAPLLWFGVPAYIALPIVTTIISLLPFVALAIILFKKERYFWAYFSLLLPVFLPLEYTFLTTLSRGFVQAHFFVPLLFIPLLYPKNTRYHYLLFIGAGLSFIANQSSVIIIIPILLYVFTYHYKSIYFYLKSLLILPFLYIDHLAKQFYIAHPERVVHKVSGIEIDGQTFNESIKSTDHFEYLFPFLPGWGILYFACFAILLGLAIYWFKTRKKVILFLLSVIALILITFAIPRVQDPFPVPAKIFFSTSRLYLFVPILFLLTLVLLFKNIKNKMLYILLLVMIGATTLVVKNLKIQDTVKEVTTGVGAGIDQNDAIKKRVQSLEKLSNTYDIDLIINTTKKGWSYYFDGYSFYPLTKRTDVISISLNGDRRTWLYEESMNSENILLNGFSIDQELLQSVDHKVLNEDQIVLFNNNKNVHQLLKELNIHYGILPY